MLTYIPVAFPSFEESVACLSDGVLRELMHDMPQHLRYLTRDDEYDVPGGSYEIWRHWFRHEDAFNQFASMVYAEAKRRKLALEASCDRLTAIRPKRRWNKPLWVGWESLHADFRSYLCHLGRCEQLAFRVCIDADVPQSVTSRKARSWLNRYSGLSSYYNMNEHTAEDVSQRLDEVMGPDPGCENHYDQFNWDVERWRGLRRAPPGPLSSYLVS